MVQPYHLVWLAKHPHRSHQWLLDRFKDGFCIHHLDGNHANDAPENLVLIDGRDHLQLHGGIPKPRVTRPGKRKLRKKQIRALDELIAQRQALTT